MITIVIQASLGPRL